MERFFRHLVSLVAVCGLAIVPAQAQNQCILCAVLPTQGANKAAKRTLRIETEAVLDFATAAHTHIGAGTIDVDARTGERRIGGSLIGLGGPAFRGTAIITGEPFARIRIGIPEAIQLISTQGARAEVSAIQTTLTADPVLGFDGRLEFTFGGRLTVAGGAAGDFRGRIALTVDYQ